MVHEFPDRRGLVYTKTIHLRVEPELWLFFETLKRESPKDIPEAQRIVLRELAKKFGFTEKSDPPGAA